MDILKKTKELCRLYDIYPARSKGQNFLIREDVYDRIAEEAYLSKDDVVLEVGPGLGFLTARLARLAKKVIAVELDDNLADTLKIAIDSQKIDNVEVINENILDFKVDYPNFKVVANLPYNITSIFLRKFLSRSKKPSIMVLMLQKEVAKRIVATPGDSSLLSLSIQFYAKAEILFDVPKENFWPEPKVNSAVVKIKIKDKLPDVDEKKFFQLAKIGFSAKRKMLKNNIASGLHILSKEAENMLIKAGLNPKIRAEDLSVDDWIKLVNE